jgi:putative ABC transport system permease protein
MQSEALDAFDVSKEPAKVQARYGDGEFARACLISRRLVERGVRMVQVYYGNSQPWDNHDDILKHRTLAADSDAPMAALLEDLKAAGLLNETIVKMHFGGENPVGQRVRLDERGPWREIVGVVRDSKDRSLGGIPLPTAYVPLAQNHETGMTLYVRTSVSPASFVASIRRMIQELEPNLPVPNIQTMTDTIGTSLYAARLGAWLLGAFGGLALVLAAIGIYGVLSFSVSRRTREMGIRLALGAEARDVFLLVVRDGMLLVGAWIIVGLAGALASGRSLASFLYGVSTTDLPTFAGVTVILTSVALVACVIPAFRAMRVNPIAALRYE